MTKSYQIYTKVKKGWRGQSSTKIDYIYQLDSFNWFGHTLHEMPLLQWLIWLLRAKASSNLVFNKAVARLGCPRTKRHPSVQECTQVIQFFQVSLLSFFAPAYPAIKNRAWVLQSSESQKTSRKTSQKTFKSGLSWTFIFLVIVVRSLSVRNKIEQKKTKKRRRRRRGGRKRRKLMSFVASTLRK